MPPLRVAFFGLPLAAILLARDGHDVAIACVSQRDAPGQRRLRRVLGAERVLVRPNVRDARLVERVRALRPDLLVSWFWTTRLPMELVGVARLGGIGVHPSLLPRHRGPDPTYWAIAEGDTETGVTVHRVAEEYDTGDVLDQERLAIDPSWNAWQLARALDRPSLRLLRRTVHRFARGEAIEAMPQDEARATYAPSPDEATCAIRWSWPTERVLRHVRALAPAPGAWTEIAAHAVTITRAAEVKAFPSGLAPGEGLVREGVAVVRTGDTAVALLEGAIRGNDDEEPRPAGAAEIARLFAPPARIG